MSLIQKPGPENCYLREHADLLISSYYKLLGKSLVKNEYAEESLYYNLFNASYGVVSHNTESTPIFNYGNQTALNLFEMSWFDFTKLASNKSAETVNRAEREKLLTQVREYGYIDNYQGVRISASGKRFMIEDATVWNIVDQKGIYYGQAAMFSKWTIL